MNLYVKLGLISFLAGTLGARFTIAVFIHEWQYIIYSFSWNLVDMFWNILPFMLLGGIPSIVFTIWRTKVWKKSGKTKEVMSLYSFVFGFMIGLLAFPFLLLAGV